MKAYLVAISAEGMLVYTAKARESINTVRQPNGTDFFGGAVGTQTARAELDS